METTESFDLAKFRENFLKLDEERQDAFLWIMRTFRAADECKIDISIYFEDIERIFKKCIESGDFTEITEHLITLILDFRSRAA